MVDGIHDFTKKKNPSKELIVSWIAGASSDISEEMIESSSFFSRVSKSWFPYATSSVFCFLFFFKVHSKIGVRIIHGHALYAG